MIRFIYFYKVLLLSLLLCFTLVSCQEDNYRKIGNKAINRIEKFKQVHNRLPNNLSEIGIILKNNDRFFHDRISDKEYRLYYQVGRSQFVSYISEKKKWDIEL